MIARVRRPIALSSVVSLLLMQGPQALAICVCDVPEAERCSTGKACAASSSAPETSHPDVCCAAARAEASGHHIERAGRCPIDHATSFASRSTSVTNDDRVSISSRCCEKQLVVASERFLATFPSVTDGAKTHGYIFAVVQAPHAIATVGVRRALLGLLRAPPGKRSSSIFLLNASFLI